MRLLATVSTRNVFCHFYIKSIITSRFCDQKQRHVTVTCEGIRVNAQYLVNASISSDIFTHAPRNLSHFFKSFNIYSYRGLGTLRASDIVHCTSCHIPDWFRMSFLLEQNVPSQTERKSKLKGTFLLRFNEKEHKLRGMALLRFKERGGNLRGTSFL